MTTRVEMELHAGMRNHSYMYNRDAANQHPMSAITGLNDKLAGMGSVVEMTAFTGAMNAATVDGPAVTVTSPTDRMSEAMWNELAVGKYIIGPEGVKIFRCTAKTETSFSAVCVSVANLRGEKGDKGDTGNTGPKGDAFKYSDFTADQLAALKGPKGDTGSTGPAGAKGDAYEITSADYEAIAEIVEDEYTEELASVKNDLRTSNRKIKALTDLLNGQELRFDTESITGASIDVASGCVADSILKVCGKSIVQDGTIVSSQTDSVKVRNKNIWNPSEATWILNTTTQTLRGYSFSPVSVKAGNTYTVHFESSVTEGYICISKELYGYNAGWVFLNGSTTTATITADSDKIYVCRYGNMPSGNLQIELGSTKTDYEPYEVQTITTSFPSLKSAGSVSDYIDLASARPSTNAGKSIVDVHRLVGSVDLGSLDWYLNSTSRFYATLPSPSKYSGSYDTANNDLCSKYETKTLNQVFANTKGIATHPLSGVNAWVYDSDYDDATALKSAMNGVILNYEKATPTTEELEIPTDLLSAINVEAGGQITFVDHNSSLAMPITTTNEWVVRNEEV